MEMADPRISPIIDQSSKTISKVCVTIDPYRSAFYCLQQTRLAYISEPYFKWKENASPTFTDGTESHYSYHLPTQSWMVYRLPQVSPVSLLSHKAFLPSFSRRKVGTRRYQSWNAKSKIWKLSLGYWNHSRAISKTFPKIRFRRIRLVLQTQLPR